MRGIARRRAVAGDLTGHHEHARPPFKASTWTGVPSGGRIRRDNRDARGVRIGDHPVSVQHQRTIGSIPSTRAAASRIASIVSGPTAGMSKEDLMVPARFHDHGIGREGSCAANVGVRAPRRLRPPRSHRGERRSSGRFVEIRDVERRHLPSEREILHFLGRRRALGEHAGRSQELVHVARLRDEDDPEIGEQPRDPLHDGHVAAIDTELWTNASKKRVALSEQVGSRKAAGTSTSLTRCACSVPSTSMSAPGPQRR